VDELVSLLGWLVVDVLLINTGRAVVFALSLGRWRGERFGGNEGRVHAMAGALSFKLDGQRVVTRSGLIFVGVAAYVAAIALVVAASV
jgi:hypothetical protein